MKSVSFSWRQREGRVEIGGKGSIKSLMQLPEYFILLTERLKENEMVRLSKISYK